MNSVTIHRPSSAIRASIELPRSKSVSNRALLMASLCGDLALVSNLSDGDDTRVMHELLRDNPQVMDCGAGGTTFRFLLAWASVREGEEHLLTGIPRLLERPHDDLINALRALGADIERVPEGYRVRGRALKGGEVHFESPISSQYLSALLMVAPLMKEGLTLRWTGTRLSEPFVHMTLKMLAHFGVYPRLELDGVRVDPGPYVPSPMRVPPDWSSAAFWYEIVALSPGAEVVLAGLGDDTMQGDREAQRLWAPWVGTRFTEKGAQLSHRAQPGTWEELPRNLRHVPDLFQPLALTLAARNQPAVFTGLDNLRVKETDRLRAVADVITRLGGVAAFAEGAFAVKKGLDHRTPGTFSPDIDHRMAMALAPLALQLGSITITDPTVVNKSYPSYWKDLEKAGFSIVFNG
ncbi:MAG: 3-phosphoshikimate 1-carboxyvinyltransferase [Flavobacteriales bacterium]|nr:3-phosphoshikimate 1-carboxyvinyltransferase [Flavobacteriales bacterium]